MNTKFLSHRVEIDQRFGRNSFDVFSLNSPMKLGEIREEKELFSKLKSVPLNFWIDSYFGGYPIVEMLYTVFNSPTSFQPLIYTFIIYTRIE